MSSDSEEEEEEAPASAARDDENDDDDMVPEIQMGDAEDDDAELYSMPAPRSSRRSARTGTESQDAATTAGSFASSQPAAGTSQAESSASAATVSPGRLVTFQKQLASLVESPVFSDDYAEFLPLLEQINAGLGAREKFEEAEARAALEVMHDRNSIMFSGDMVYKV